MPFEPEIYAATVHQGGLAVLDSELKLHYNVLAGEPGRVISLPSLYPEREWDVAIASTGENVAVVSVSPDGLDLRLATAPDRIAAQFLEAPTHFIQLNAGGGRLLAVANSHQVAWASFEGDWLGEPSHHPEELPRARIPEGNGFGELSSLANGSPAGYDATGAAIFLSTDEHGRILRWTVTPDAAELDEGALPSVGPRYFSDLTATYHEGRFGVLWTQRESSASSELFVGAAVLDRDLQLVGDVIATKLRGSTGWGSMSVVYCLDRFLLSWRDFEWQEQRPSVMRQLDDMGKELEPPIEIPYSSERSGWHLHCLGQKAAISAAAQLFTLECEAK